MKMRIIYLLTLLLLLSMSCAKQTPYLSGHIRRAHDAIKVSCDPYNLGSHHSCLVFSAAFRESVYVFDLTAREMVLGPIGFFPLQVKVGRLTDDLLAVASDREKFPFMYGLDHQEGAVYPIRLFPEGELKSFFTPKAEKLPKIPFKMAFVEVTDKIIGIATLPKEGNIELWAFDKATGVFNSSIATRTIKVGTRPSYVEIDSERKVAVISDEGENNLHALDLANLDDVLTKASVPTLKSIAMGMVVNKIHLSRRDFGEGENLYALVSSASLNQVILANVDKTSKLADLTLADYPMAAYFPDKDSATCCDDVKNWVSVVTIKGNLIYIAVKHENQRTTLEKAKEIDLTAETNLGLNKIHVKRIIGGHILTDGSLDQEDICSSHSETFYIASFGNDRTDIVESEAHGRSCEGEGSASLFGVKRQQ